MTYLIELEDPSGLLAYVIAQAETRDAARALIDTHLERDDASDLIIVAVHTIHQVILQSPTLAMVEQ